MHTLLKDLDLRFFICKEEILVKAILMFFIMVLKNASINAANWKNIVFKKNNHKKLKKKNIITITLLFIAQRA